MLAVCIGILAHLWMLANHNHEAWTSLATVAMAAGCLPCVPRLWSNPGAAPARKLMVMALAMAAFHGILLILSGQNTGHGPHVHTMAGMGTSPDGAAAMLMVLGIELITAFLAATVVKAHRNKAVQPGHRHHLHS
ncbi:MAG TPA: hypothetical protein VJP90_08540 [Paenarthrobacter sp.]|nr:hypothetical protein [Paenarthrobacter sp.]